MVGWGEPLQLLSRSATKNSDRYNTLKLQLHIAHPPT